MSEFSESYHLRGNTLDEGVALLRSAGLHGFVFKPTSGWVTILPAGEMFTLNHRLIRANTSVLLRYFFAEDHGWGFAVYRHAFPSGQFEVDWNADVLVKHPCTLATLDLLLPHHSADQRAALAAALNAVDPKQVIGNHNAQAFAEALGLLNYSWLSYDGAVNDYADPTDSGSELVACEPQHPADFNAPFMFRPGTAA